MTDVVVDGVEFRVDVFTIDWEKALTGSKGVPTPYHAVVDGLRAEVDGVRLRVDVQTDHWNRLTERLKKGQV